VNEPLVGNAMERATDHVEVARLQRELESERAKHAATIARNLELERELLRERTVVTRLEEDHKNLRARYENDVQRLVRALQALEDAEERLVAQFGDLEAEAMEQNRHFNAEIHSLSQSLSKKEQDLVLSRTEIDSIRQRQVSLKELEAMDLAAELLKSSRECDRMKLQTEALQAEVERARSEATNLRQELAVAKLVKTIQEERSVPSQQCRSESARLVTQRRTRHAALAV
jgi:chromosome segregation ATPase